MTDDNHVRALEERGFNAWPARQTLFVGGWVLRLSDGLTKRANSANALCPAAPFPEVMRVAEEIYARHGLPTIFRLSPLAGAEADRTLEDAGYRIIDPSLVLTTAISEAPVTADVRISAAPTKAWLEGFAAANAIPPDRRPLHDRIVGAIALPTGFATLYDDGRAIGFGIGVYDRGMVGLFDIIVAPAARRRGAGTELTRALLNWGRSMGARQAYLQVIGDNAPARALYGKLGFGEAYRYHYRIAPETKARQI